jgi:hypothetical protein
MPLKGSAGAALAGLVCLLATTGCSGGGSPTRSAARCGGHAATSCNTTVRSTAPALQEGGPSRSGSSSTLAPTRQGGGSGGSGSGSSVAAGGGSTSPPPCSVAPASLVSGALGISLSGPVASTHGDATLCTYEPATGSGPRTVNTSVEFQAGVTAQTFASEQRQAAKDNTVDPVSGLGVGAFSFSIATASSTFTVLYVLTASSGGIQVGISSPASLSAEESLARQILPLI